MLRLPIPRARAIWLDASLSLAGLLFGAASLAFPFGRDQGLFYYVGREWLLRGAIPYRDTFEQKTPGVFMIHALTIALFGEQTWGIRLFELMCVMGIGFACASLATPPGPPPREGVRGASALVGSILYFGLLDYWDTAQCEIWATASCIFGMTAALRLRHRTRGALLAGALAGFIVLMKPPAIWMSAGVGIAVAARAYREAQGFRRRAAPIAAFTLGFTSIVGGLILYFAAHSALGPMYDVVVRANLSYRPRESFVSTPVEAVRFIVVEFDKSFEPMSGVLAALLLTALVVALIRRDRPMLVRFVLVASLVAAALAGVITQLKLPVYHFGLLIGPLVLLFANLATDLLRLLEQPSPWRARASLFVLVSVVVAAFALTRSRAETWWDQTSHTYAWLAGRISRAEFADTFALPKVFYNYREAEDVAIWLRDHSEPSDTVSVRGFEPEIYVIAHRHRVGRFFWTLSLDTPERTYKRAEWLAEDRKALIDHPPTWVIVASWVREGPESATYFEELGYERVKEMPGYTVLRLHKA